MRSRLQLVTIAVLENELEDHCDLLSQYHLIHTFGLIYLKSYVEMNRERTTERVRRFQFGWNGTSGAHVTLMKISVKEASIQETYTINHQGQWILSKTIQQYQSPFDL